MKFLATRFILIALSFILLMPTHANAEEFTEAQKAEINKMMEEFLMSNGENILKSVNQYQADLQEKDRIEASKKAEGFIAEVKKQPNLPYAGNKKGDITLIEFFDYNCGYCRRALEEINTVLKEDDNLKVVFMDMPILGPGSREIAEWSLAANKQGRYFDYHQAIFEHEGPKDAENLEKIAKKIGLNVKKLKKDKDHQEIGDIIEQNIAQAGTMGIRGTPGFIIGDQVYPGFIEAAEIKKVIADARAKASGENKAEAE